MNYFIKILAYFHRYCWIAIVPLCVGGTSSLYAVGLILIIFSLWTLLGYWLKWKHIFCSFQDAQRMKMTPNHISWDKIRKGDVYAVSATFFVLGLALIIVLQLL